MLKNGGSEKSAIWNMGSLIVPLNRDSPCPFFSAKSHSVTQRLVYQENSLKRANTRRLFFAKQCYSNWQQFSVSKISKFEFKLKVHYGLW